jgi:hypothetical protein
LSCMQALPARHPIVASVAADRAARQAAGGISPDTLTAAGAQPLLGPASNTSPAAAVRGNRGSADCDRLLAAAAGDVEGGDGGGEKDLLFCCKNWLVQVDRHTGEPTAEWLLQ